MFKNLKKKKDNIANPVKKEVKTPFPSFGEESLMNSERVGNLKAAFSRDNWGPQLVF